MRLDFFRALSADHYSALTLLAVELLPRDVIEVSPVGFL